MASNKISIGACDNELDLFAYRWNESIFLARILSGNSNSVDVRFDIVTGGSATPPSQPVVVNGIDAPINQGPIVINIPASSPNDPYTLQVVGLNWGATYDFKGSVGSTVFSASDHSKDAPLGCVFSQTFPLEG
jgi:hypothetical protein